MQQKRVAKHCCFATRFCCSLYQYNYNAAKGRTDMLPTYDDSNEPYVHHFTNLSALLSYSDAS